MKIGTDPAADVARVRSARDAIGPDAELFVDANGAYDRKAGAREGRGIRRSWRELVRGAGFLRRS